MEEKTKFCKYCGEKIPEEAVICTKCGRQVEELKEKKDQNIIINNNNNANAAASASAAANGGRGGRPKNKWIALLLCFFFGWLGAHKFYEEKTGLGILYLFTCGLFGIGCLVDFIALIFKPVEYYV